MADQHRYGECERGFTLLELLAVIAILGLILVALTGGVRFAGRAWETQERLIARQGDLDAVQSVLRQMIASGHSFQGDSASLSFVGTLPRALNDGGLFDIVLRATEGRLVLDWQPHLNGAALPEEPMESELARNVSSVEFTYYFAKGDELGGWQRESKDKGKPPALVGVAVQNDKGRAWPPLVVATMIERAAK